MYSIKKKPWSIRIIKTNKIVKWESFKNGYKFRENNKCGVSIQKFQIVLYSRIYNTYIMVFYTQNKINDVIYL